jgi:tRNA1(Val) A37 N6-methylase TrmN6
VRAFEVQERYADLTRRNAELNSLIERLTVECADVREVKRVGEFDLVFTNPPYMKTSSGFANLEDGKNIARHEVFGTIDELCASASKMLKFGGTFAVVYRPDRLTDLICAMRAARLEPKRITFVHARSGAQSSMVLIEAKMGGKSGAILTRPLIIYDERGEYTADMNYIMENGSFPADFSR